MSCAEETPDPSHQGSGAVVRAKFRPGRGPRAAVKPEAPAPPGQHRRTRGERLARQLALAHWIDRAVEEGRVASYEVARLLGLTESRITQVTALLGLSSELQERIVLGEAGIGIREAIRAGREAEWERQDQKCS